MASMFGIRLIVTTLALSAPVLLAQKHGGRSAPPTAPPPPVVAAPVPIVPASSGMGAIQFVQVNYGVPAPQSLTRQLRFDDDRTRAAALSAIGAPNQYLQHGHIPMPRAIALDLVPIGTTDDLDAMLTVELDQHIVTAVLVPVDGNWRRIASFVYATPFDNGTVTPTTWLRTALHDPEGPLPRTPSSTLLPAPSPATTPRTKPTSASSTANPSSPSASSPRRANVRPPHHPPLPASPSRAPPPNPAARLPNANWFQPDPRRPYQKVRASHRHWPRLPQRLPETPLASSRTMLLSQLRTFSCQPFLYSESTQHYEPTAPNAPCKNK